MARFHALRTGPAGPVAPAGLLAALAVLLGLVHGLAACGGDGGVQGDPGGPGDGSGDGDGDGDGSGDGDGDGDGDPGASGDPCHPDHDPATDELIHTGALAGGTTSVALVGSVYELRFDGDETLRYEIDLSDDGVRGGLLRVREAVSGAHPLWEGGAAFRTADGALQPPTFLVPGCTLVDARIEDGAVVLDYEDQVAGGKYRRRHTFELRGKTLRVRVRSLDDRRSWASNYAGLAIGRTADTPEPLLVRMQGTLATPLVLFESLAGPRFVATQLDLTQSSASDFHLDDAETVVPGADSIDFGYDTAGLYLPDTEGRLSATLDDTLSVVVTSRLADAFVVGTQPTSPYRDRIATRTVALLADGDTTWEEYGQQLERLRQGGLDGLVTHAFFWWSASLKEGNQNVGPDWAPAEAEESFVAFVSAAVGRGALVGVYTTFLPMPTTSPFYQPEDIVTGADGQMKTANFLSPVPLGAASDAALLDDVERETGRLEAYGLNLSFVDAVTSAAPSWPADNVDQNADSPWPKTLRDCIRARKEWFTVMRDGLDGPLLGEGSIFRAAGNMEWLWAGYVDSVERSLNTGAGAKSVDLPAGSPAAPTAWPVLPDYELHVARRQRADHGNAFYDRFFSAGDGLGVVVGGDVQYPLSRAALDRYRLYELTYAHTSFFLTNGSPSPVSNFLNEGEMLKEHYLVAGLQEHTLFDAVEAIEYRAGGGWQSTQERLVSAGSLDAFRDPRLRVRYDSGLVLYLNHSPNDWTVALADEVLGEDVYVLPEDGFLAHRSGTELLVLSGWTQAVPGERFDYAHLPGRWTFFDGRGRVEGYAGTSTVLPTGGPPQKGIAVHHLAEDLTLVQRESGVLVPELGDPPALVSIAIEPATLELAVGEAAGLRAIGHYENGAWRDLSTLVEWTETDAGVHVTRGGAVIGCSAGSAAARAEDYEGMGVTPAEITVVPAE